MTRQQLAGLRDRLRDLMIEHAREDPACAAAAVLGSAARREEDEWSDIDLGVRLAPGADLDQALGEWTDWLASRVRISDHLDIRASGAVYRAFLCDSALQIDLSLWPWDRFRGLHGEAFRLVFGDALEPAAPDDRDWLEPARMGWLYALHARSAIQRRRRLQADLMLARWREHIIALASTRCGLNPVQGREAHLLPAEVEVAVGSSRPADLSPDELRDALTRTAAVYLAELRNHDAEYAERLKVALDELVR